jgi:hypothetical protein
VKSEARTLALATAAGTIATIAVFSRVVFGDLIFFERDMRLVVLPVKRYWAERIAQGQFPDWYPFDGLGQPFAGMMVSGAFHPFNVLYLFLPLGTAGDWNILLCFPLAFLGTFLFARGLTLSAAAAGVAATLYAFNGYSICITHTLPYLMAASTVPWALWAMDRLFSAPSLLRAAVAALLLALVLFAGDPQSFAISSALSVALMALRFERGRWLALAALALLTGLFAAPQIVAALHAASQAVSGARTLHEATRLSLHPLQLLDLALGPIFGGSQGLPPSRAIDIGLLGSEEATNLWTDSIHLGLPALGLALFGLWTYRRERRAWGLFAAFLVFLLLALGRHGGLYRVMFELLPLWRPFRYPAKLTPYLELSLALGAGFGAQAALRSADASRAARWTLAGLALFCAALGALELWWSPARRYVAWALRDSAELGAVSNRLHQTFLVACVSTALALAAAALAVSLLRRPNLALSLLGTILFGYLALSNLHLYGAGMRAVVEEKTGFLSAIEADAQGEPVRVFSLVSRYRYPSVPGADSAELAAMADAFGLIPDLPALWHVSVFNGYLPATGARLMSLHEEVPPLALARLSPIFATRYVVALEAESKKLEQGGATILRRQRDFDRVLIRVPAYNPRAYLAHPRCVQSQAEARRELLARAFDPLQTALVECASPLADAPGPTGTVRLRTDLPERIELDVESPGPAVLVVNDAFYSGWSARVDGRPAPILAANLLVRGIPVRAGRHSVELVYRTPGLRPALAVSALAMLLSFGVGLARSRKTTA